MSAVSANCDTAVCTPRQTVWMLRTFRALLSIALMIPRVLVARTIFLCGRSRLQRRPILFFCAGKEPNLLRLKECAEWLKVRYEILDIALLRESQITSSIDHAIASHDLNSGGSAMPFEFSGVWNRGFTFGSLPSERTAENLIYFEWKYYLSYLLQDSARLALWMNSAGSIAHSSNRLVQLRDAASFGFHVPATIVTNDPRRAREFARAHSVIAIKQICGGGDHQLADRSLSTKRLTDADDYAFDQVTYCPSMLQEYIDKELELRITIVRDHIYCAAIESQKHERCSVDSRMFRGTGLTYYPYELDSSTKSRLIGLVRHYGLNYAAIDIILDRQGRYVFLEVNSSGQWQGIETFTGDNVTETIVRALSGGLDA